MTSGEVDHRAVVADGHQVAAVGQLVVAQDQTERRRLDRRPAGVEARRGRTRRSTCCRRRCPAGRPSGITPARPTSPRAASLASTGMSATSSGVRPPSSSSGSSAQPSGTQTTYFTRVQSGSAPAPAKNRQTDFGVRIGGQGNRSERRTGLRRPGVQRQESVAPAPAPRRGRRPRVRSARVGRAGPTGGPATAVARRPPPRRRRGTWPGGPWRGTRPVTASRRAPRRTAVARRHRPRRRSAGRAGSRCCPACGEWSTRAASSSSRPQSNSVRSASSTSGPTDTVPSARNDAIRSATAAPSRPSTSNNSRSRFELTWMSIDGLVVGTTSRRSIVPVVKNRVRMSLRLDATTRRSIGQPHLLGGPPGEDVAEVARSARSS